MCEIRNSYIERLEEAYSKLSNEILEIKKLIKPFKDCSDHRYEIWSSNDILVIFRDDFWQDTGLRVQDIRALAELYERMPS